VIEFAAVAAIAAVAGGAVAVTARDRRTLSLGLAVALVAAPLASSPVPGTLALAARIAGAFLAAELLFVATRVKSVRSGGSAIGLAAEGAAATAAFLVGLWIAPVKPLPGPATEQAAGLALLLLAAIPLTGKDVLRVGVGAALLALGLSMLRDAWLGTAQPFENLVVAALLVAIVGAAGLLAPRRSAESPDSDGTADEAPDADESVLEPGPEGGIEPGYDAAYEAIYGADSRTGSVEADMGPDDYEGAPPPLPASYRSKVRQTRNPRGSEPHR
jgi:hypothetical protein